MATKIAIMGAGPGGYVAAVRAAQQGAEVTIVEREHVGGTCLNWGCIPSKIMIATAGILDKFHRASEFGIETQGTPRADMVRLMARKNSIIETQRKGILDRIEAEKKKAKVTVTRFKGLGEMDPEQLRETTMNRDTRRLVQLTVSGRDKTDQMLDMLLSKKRAKDRRSWLETKGDLAEV